MMDWQPIKTAPENTPVLTVATREGWEQHDRRRIVCAIKLPDRRDWVVYGAGVWRFPGDDDGWQQCDTCIPTHWMPLPPMPGAGSVKTYLRYPHIQAEMAHLYGANGIKVMDRLCSLLPQEDVPAVLDDLMKTESYDDLWRAMNTVISIADWDEIESQMEEGE